MKVIVLLIQVPLFALMATIAIGSAPHFSVLTISTSTDQDSGSQMTTTKVVAILMGDDVLARPRRAKGMVNSMSTAHLVDNKVREATVIRMRQKSCMSINPRFISIEDSTGEAVFGAIV